MGDAKNKDKAAAIVEILVNAFIKDKNALQVPENWDTVSTFFFLLGIQANKINNAEFFSKSL